MGKVSHDLGRVFTDLKEFVLSMVTSSIEWMMKVKQICNIYTEFENGKVNRSYWQDSEDFQSV